MLNDGNAGGLLEKGDQSGLEQLFNQGQFEQCLNLAEKHSTDLLNSYLERYTKKLLHNGEYKKAGVIFNKYGCPQDNALLPIYKTLALEILAGSKDDETLILRDMLQRLCDNLALSLDEKHPIFREFYEYLFISHLMLVKAECARNSNLQ